MTIVIPRVKLFQLHNVINRSSNLFFQLLHVVLLCKNFFRIMLFFKFLHALTFATLGAFTYLVNFYNFQAHSLHSCCNTHYKTQNHSTTTLNVKNLMANPSSHFFHLGQFTIFAINVHFFQAPHSFHDGHVHVCAHGNNYCLSLVQMCLNPLHSSIYHCSHLPLHPLLFY